MKKSIAAKIQAARDSSPAPPLPACLGSPTEKHYSPADVALWWGVDTSTVIRAFRDTPGVLKIPSHAGKRGKREYVTLRIPESMLVKWWQDRTK